MSQSAKGLSNTLIKIIEMLATKKFQGDFIISFRAGFPIVIKHKPMKKEAISKSNILKEKTKKER